MTGPIPQPVDVQLLPDAVHIRWDDGHETFLEHRYLRSQCGCAACVHEMTGQRLIYIADIRSDVMALDWMQIGRYAVRFLWSDLHDTGIYPYVLLRALCTCNECAPSTAQQDT